MTQNRGKMGLLLAGFIHCSLIGFYWFVLKCEELITAQLHLQIHCCILTCAWLLVCFELPRKCEVSIVRSKNSNLSLSEQRHCLATQTQAGNEHKEAGNRGLPVLARMRTGKCERPDNLMRNGSLVSLLVFHSHISLCQPEIHSASFQ